MLKLKAPKCPGISVAVGHRLLHDALWGARRGVTRRAHSTGGGIPASSKARFGRAVSTGFHGLVTRGKEQFAYYLVRLEIGDTDAGEVSPAAASP